MNNPEKPNVREFAIGSICEIVNTVSTEFLGREVTVLGHLSLFTDIKTRQPTWAYLVDIKDNGKDHAVKHNQLRLKKFPPETDAWCREKMKWLLKDDRIPDERLASQGVKETQHGY